jgi:hypothetical protein
LHVEFQILRESYFRAFICQQTLIRSLWLVQK